MELPDWLRGLVLLGRDGAEYRVVALDADGNMGVILQAAAEVTIPGDVNVTQDDSIREMQGKEGVTLRTVAVDADGQIIMVPRGSTGNYMAVDANGYLGAILKAAAEVTIPGDVNVTQDDSIREMQGKEGVTLRTVAVDANGQIIMVPRGSTGNYMAVDGTGFLTAIMKGTYAGLYSTSVACDVNGHMIMIPRGASGYNLAVDASGFMTTVMKGTYGATLKTLAADDEGYLVAILKDEADQWGKKVSVGIGELAARLGSPMFWDRRGQIVKMQTFADGYGYCTTSHGGTGSAVAFDTDIFQFGKQSVKLTAGTDGAFAADVTLWSDYSPASIVGFEFTFSLDTEVSWVYAEGRVWDGVNENQIYLRWHAVNGKLQIKNDTAAWPDVCDFQLPAVPQLFVTVKVVANLSTQQWVRLLYRGQEYDISAIKFWRAASDVHPYLTYKVQALGTVTTNRSIYVDRMIVTTNEP